MRADRLLSLLLLLQLRGRTTAQRLAKELEVSERTVYRDLQALSVAGVPVYAERGPGGGCELLDSYRTSLTGFDEQELRALFMLNIPSALNELGMSEALRSALLKLAAALPAARREAEVHTRQRIYLDTSRQAIEHEATPHVRTIYRAVWDDRKLEIAYRFWFGNELRSTVAPYGLVARGSDWYLVYHWDKTGTARAIRVADLNEVRLLDEHFERPQGFDLVAFWARWSGHETLNRPTYPVRIRVWREFFPWLPRFYGAALRQALAAAPPADANGWQTIALEFESLEAARECLLGLGGAVEVLEPEALRLSMADFARQILARYPI
ncbi:MAG: helix-turn-helix transcriptional regulator [Chloroflexota bacterium]